MNWCICDGLDDLWSRSHVLCVFGGKSNKVENVLAFFQGHWHVEYTVIQLFTQNISELDNAHPLWGNPCGLLCQPTHLLHYSEAPSLGGMLHQIPCLPMSKKN